MAIYSAVPPPPELAATTANSNQQQQEEGSHQLPDPTTTAASPTSNGADIEAWTISALEALSVSPVARGTGAPLSIPLDEHLKKPSVAIQDPRSKSTTITPPPRPLSRRDSQRRREALLKGKEGSRQRRRWENDRLMHVPNAQPPEPFDWEPRPLHPVNHVPYQIAAMWDLRVRAEVEKRKTVAARRKQMHTRTLGDEHVSGRVPRELFQRAKKTPAVKTWVRSLEEPVRRYLIESEIAKESPSTDEGETEDEEIVFVGRNGSMRDGWKKAKRDTKGKTMEEGMIFDALDDDADSAFRYDFEITNILIEKPHVQQASMGLLNLPSETLSLVLEFLGSEDLASLILVQCVCKRFQEIAARLLFHCPDQPPAGAAGTSQSGGGAGDAGVSDASAGVNPLLLRHFGPLFDTALSSPGAKTGKNTTVLNKDDKLPFRALPWAAARRKKSKLTEAAMRGSPHLRPEASWRRLSVTWGVGPPIRSLDVLKVMTVFGGTGMGFQELEIPALGEEGKGGGEGYLTMGTLYDLLASGRGTTGPATMRWRLLPRRRLRSYDAWERLRARQTYPDKEGVRALLAADDEAAATLFVEGHRGCAGFVVRPVRKGEGGRTRMRGSGVRVRLGRLGW
ncbi:hypothetical protein AAE478_000652 [Parahypoxylon ruwenzoriense]